MAIFTIPEPEPTPPPVRRAKWVEQALEIRAGDLLRMLKKSAKQFVRKGFKFDGVAVFATLDLRCWEDPNLLVEIHLIESNQTHMQQFPLEVAPGGFGGWSGYFLCPALSPVGEPCGRRVRSLLLPPPPAISRFACRHCHQLIHFSKQRWHRGARKLRKAERSVPTDHGQGDQPQAVIARRKAVIPPELVEEQWVDSLPETAAGRSRRFLEQTWLALKPERLDPDKLNRI